MTWNNNFRFINFITPEFTHRNSNVDNTSTEFTLSMQMCSV